MKNALAVLLLVALAACERKQTAPAAQYQPRSDFLSMGDPAAGAETFFALKCNACHSVVGEERALNGRTLHGPKLGSTQAAQDPLQIASSIIAPEHVVSDEEGPWREGGASSMGDYTRVMTVRQLMDLVSYIRSLPSRPKAPEE